MALLDEVKTALRVTTTAYDESEILPLIEAAKIDLQIADVDSVDYADEESYSAIVRRAIVTYCRLNFGSPTDFERLKKSYDEQKAQLSMSSEWGHIYAE